MNQTPELIGPAALVLRAAVAVTASRASFAVLLDGDPGVGKTTVADALALQITGNRHSVEWVNGQSLNIELVRQWRCSAPYGNLFSPWTIKRVDELDHASPAAMAEMLTLLDTLPRGHAIVATTNEFSKLRAASKGRLDSRFIRFNVQAPSVDDVAAHLVRKFHLTKSQAKQIALGSVPDGELATAGCNVRTAQHDAEALAAVQAVLKAA